MTSRASLSGLLALLAACSGAPERRAPAESPPPPRVITQPPSPAPPAAEAAPTPEEKPAAPLAVRAPEPTGALARLYVGEHALGVNRVTDGRRTGSVLIRDEGGVLRLEGTVQQGIHFLSLSGIVEPISAQRFVLVGKLKGVPDMAWADEAPRARETAGRFQFEATKGRKFWRMYEVDGKPCVCDAGCGNDFCYIDIELAVRASP